MKCSNCNSQNRFWEWILILHKYSMHVLNQLWYSIGTRRLVNKRRIFHSSKPLLSVEKIIFLAIVMKCELRSASLRTRRFWVQLLAGAPEYEIKNENIFTKSCCIFFYISLNYTINNFLGNLNNVQTI